MRHVGCKDVGLPRDELAALMDDIRAQRPHDATSRSCPRRRRRRSQSARVAAEIGPDYLIGGTLIEPVQEILAGTGIKFFPYVGQIVGHPCLLRGIDRRDRRRRPPGREPGRRRHQPARLPLRRDVDALVEAVVGATSLPVIAAGSVDSAARIQALAERGVWAFTIGTAALDGVLVEGAPLDDQLRYALDAAAAVV